MPVYALGNKTPDLPDDDNCWIAPDAHVVGSVTLGNLCSIWFGAVLRGDNEPITLGARTNIQEGVMIHVDPGFAATIGDGCTIGHHAIIHGCTIGDGSLVGMGATVLNGAVIGRECLVGANALVTEGREFPDRSLIVGAPARAIRTLSDADVAGMQAAAASYVERSGQFRTDLNVIR